MDGQETCFSSVNAIKADFNDIYRSKDPRRYFKVLGELGYIIPEVAAPVLLRLVEHLIYSKGRPVTILDVGCSYGILAALMRYGLTIGQLRDRYKTAPMQALSSDDLASYDTQYFAGWPRRSDVRFIGLDCSAEAIAYALRVGLIEEGLVVDLETAVPNKRACSVISKVDLIVSTGVVGYVSERTFAELLKTFPSGHTPWIASFVLRMFDYGDIAATIGQHNLATERLDGVTFQQRRFRDASEFENALRLIQARGLDPAGREAEGVYHAELFVSRPSADISKAGLQEIVQPIEGMRWSEPCKFAADEAFACSAD
jgi:SAM-dependent methyltransferase